MVWSKHGDRDDRFADVRTTSRAQKMKSPSHLARLAVEPDGLGREADLLRDLAHDLLVVHVRLGRDLTEDHDHVGLRGRLARHLNKERGAGVAGRVQGEANFKEKGEGTKTDHAGRCGRLARHLQGGKGGGAQAAGVRMKRTWGPSSAVYSLGSTKGVGARGLPSEWAGKIQLAA